MKFLRLTFKFSGKWTTKTDVIPVALKCMLFKDIDIESESVQVFIDFVIKPLT
jgi:hypothetical protein